jgi:hypothetical protein
MDLKEIGLEDNIRVDPKKIGRIILVDLKEMGFEDVDRILPTQSKDRWRAVANTTMNFRVL